MIPTNYDPQYLPSLELTSHVSGKFAGDLEIHSSMQCKPSILTGSYSQRDSLKGLPSAANL